MIPAGKTICVLVRSLYDRPTANMYFVGRRVEVRVDHRRIHLPLLNVSGLPEFLPILDLVIHAKGE